MLRLVIVLLVLVPLIIKAESKLQNDIAYLETRVELVDFTALRRAANDLSKRYPSQYDLQADLAQLNLFEKDYQKHKINFQKISIQLNANSNEVDEELVKAINYFNKLIAFKQMLLLKNPAINFDEILLIRRQERGNIGLPQNWQSNSSLNKYGWNNEIATMSITAADGEIKTLYKPLNNELISDLELHFNSNKIMFSMPGKNKRWQIFEMPVLGGEPMQLPLIPDSDVDNYDACYLPDDNILFTSTAPFVGVPCVKGSSHVTNSYLLNTKTNQIRRLTFDQEHNWCPTVLNNGKVLYLRWEYSDIPHFPSRILFSMNPDGTNQREYYGSNSYWPNAIFYARPIPGHPTKVVGIVGGHHGAPRMGEMVIFDPALGRFEADGVVQRITDYGEKVEPLILDRLVDDSWPKFLHPFPIDEKYFLVSAKLNEQANWGVYLVDVHDNMLLLKEEPGSVLFDPIPLKKQKVPPVIPSRVDEESEFATMYINNIYLGEGLKGVPKGTVKNLRLFTYQFAYHGMGGQVNRVGLDGPWDIKRILGTVPVEPDGSAIFKVPANTPISMQPLDADGKAIALMRSWATAMPGEVLSCVGCHESQNSVPPSGMRMASKRAVSEIKPWYGETRGFGFIEEVQPVLDKYCVNCHDGQKNRSPNFTDREPVEVDCTAEAYKTGTKFSPSYIALRSYVRGHTIENDMHLLQPYEFHANNTELIRILEKGHHNVELSAEAKSRLYAWIDLNTPYHGNWTGMLGSEMVENQRKRRIDLMRRYSTRDDDEDTVQPVTGKKGNPVIPQPLSIESVINKFKTESLTASKEKIAIDIGDSIDLEIVKISAIDYKKEGTSSKPYWIGQFEITNEQFKQFNPDHDSHIEYGDFLQFSVRERGYLLNTAKQPVCRISWEEANAFCSWLSHKTGKNFSLPTDDQWEWACRAGVETSHWYGEDEKHFSEYANMADSTLEVIEKLDFGLPIGAIPKWRPSVSNENDGYRVSAPVGSYKANPWDLYDILGNVAEWTQTDYATDKKSVRGGSWYDRPKHASATTRWGYYSWQKVYNVGFRVVMDE